MQLKMASMLTNVLCLSGANITHFTPISKFYIKKLLNNLSLTVILLIFVASFVKLFPLGQGLRPSTDKLDPFKGDVEKSVSFHYNKGKQVASFIRLIGEEPTSHLDIHKIARRHFTVVMLLFFYFFIYISAAKLTHFPDTAPFFDDHFKKLENYLEDITKVLIFAPQILVC